MFGLIGAAVGAVLGLFAVNQINQANCGVPIGLVDCTYYKPWLGAIIGAGIGFAIGAYADYLRRPPERRTEEDYTPTSELPRIWREQRRSRAAGRPPRPRQSPMTTLQVVLLVVCSIAALAGLITLLEYLIG